MLPRIRMCPHDYSSKFPCLQPSRQAQLLSNAGSSTPAANACHEVDSGTRLSRLARFGDPWYPRAPSTRAVAWMMLREYHLARRELIGLGCYLAYSKITAFLGTAVMSHHILSQIIKIIIVDRIIKIQKNSKKFKYLIIFLYIKDKFSNN